MNPELETRGPEELSTKEEPVPPELAPPEVEPPPLEVEPAPPDVEPVPPVVDVDPARDVLLLMRKDALDPVPLLDARPDAPEEPVPEEPWLEERPPLLAPLLEARPELEPPALEPLEELLLEDEPDVEPGSVPVVPVQPHHMPVMPTATASILKRIPVLPWPTAPLQGVGAGGWMKTGRQALLTTGGQGFPRPTLCAGGYIRTWRTMGHSQAGSFSFTLRTLAAQSGIMSTCPWWR